MPNADQKSGIDPNVDQFWSMLINADFKACRINAMILIGIWALIEGVLLVEATTHSQPNCKDPWFSVQPQWLERKCLEAYH